MLKKEINKLNKKLKGFSLLEMVIVVFIFSLAITTAVAVFANVFFTGKKTRDVQRNMETARTALELMAKNMRMTSDLNGDSTQIYMFNNSQGQCITYRFDNTSGELQMGQTNAETDDTNCEPSNLTTEPYPSPLPAIAENIDSGSFYIIPTDEDTVGKATVRMTIQGEELQTTVSFRDYLANIYQ